MSREVEWVDAAEALAGLEYKGELPTTPSQHFDFEFDVPDFPYELLRQLSLGEPQTPIDTLPSAPAEAGASAAAAANPFNQDEDEADAFFAVAHPLHERARKPRPALKPLLCITDLLTAAQSRLAKQPRRKTSVLGAPRAVPTSEKAHRQKHSAGTSRTAAPGRKSKQPNLAFAAPPRMAADRGMVGTVWRDEDTPTAPPRPTGRSGSREGSAGPAVPLGMPQRIAAHAAIDEEDAEGAARAAKAAIDEHNRRVRGHSAAVSAPGSKPRLRKRPANVPADSGSSQRKKLAHDQLHKKKAPVRPCTDISAARNPAARGLMARNAAAATAAPDAEVLAMLAEHNRKVSKGARSAPGRRVPAQGEAAKRTRATSRAATRNVRGSVR